MRELRGWVWTPEKIYICVWNEDIHRYEYYSKIVDIEKPNMKIRRSYLKKLKLGDVRIPKHLKDKVIEDA